MLNYIRAELGRLFTKRSSYIYYGLLSLGYIAMSIFMLDVTASTYLTGLPSLVPVVLVFVFIQAFVVIYSEELSSKTLGTSLSTGLPRTALVVSKLIITLIYIVAVLTFLSLIAAGVYAFLGGNFNQSDMLVVKGTLMVLSYNLFANMVYITFTSVLVYFFQSSSLGIVMFSLLAMNIESAIISLLVMALPQLQFLSDYSIGTTISNMFATYTMQGLIDWAGIGLLSLYALVATVISILVFRKRDVNLG